MLFFAAMPFTLVGGEIFTKILLPQSLDSSMDIYSADTVIGFTYQPGARAFEKGREYNAFYEINGFGLRDREYGAKEVGVFTALLVGDSFSVSHGLPIDDSLSRQLERALQKEAMFSGRSIKIQVVNAAAGGYSPYNYWKAYGRWAPVFKPDIIVVGLSPDDYDCDNEFSSYVVENGRIQAIVKKGETRKTVRRSRLREIRHWLSWNSELYVLLRNFFYYNDFIGMITRKASAKNKSTVDQLQQYMVPIPVPTKARWEKALGYLSSLRDEAKTDGVPVVVIPIPLKLEIDDKEYTYCLGTIDLKPDRFDRDQIAKMLTDYCDMERIPIVDPRQAMRKRNAEAPCYFVYDGHWNAEGVRAAAISIAAQWRDLKLPPFSTVPKRQIERNS